MLGISPLGRRGAFPNRAWTRWTRKGVIALAFLELLYLVIANCALQSGWVQGRINSRPDHFHISWKSATTWIPGWVRLQGVGLIGQGTRDIYYGYISNCTFRLRCDLIWNKEIRCGRFRAQGVDFRLSQAFDADRDDAARQALFPPIPGLEGVPRRTGPRTPPTSDPWKIILSDIGLENIVQVWLKDARIRGPSSLKGSLVQEKDGRFRTEVTRYRLNPGSITIGGNNSFTNLNLELTGSLGPIVFDDAPDDEIYSFISAHLRGEGELREISLLPAKPQGSDGIKLTGIGRFHAEVRVQNGLYLSGSRLRLDSSSMALHINEFLWEGKAHLEGLIETVEGQPTARFDCKLENLSFQRGTNANHALGETEIVIHSEAHDLRMVGQFQDANLKVHISPMAVPDAVVLNEFLPASLGTSFRTGTITVAADFDRDSGKKLRGRMSVEGHELSAQIMQEEYQLDLFVATQFHSDSLKGDRFEISGSSVVCTNIWVSKLPRAKQEGWHARLALGNAFLTTQPSRVLEGTLEYDLRDTRPIMVLLRQQPDSPSWLRFVPTIKDIQGTLLLKTTTNSVSLQEINLRGKGTEILGYLNIEEPQLTGLLYTRWGILSLGFDLREKDRHWKLLAARRWYDRIVNGVAPFEREP